MNLFQIVFVPLLVIAALDSLYRAWRGITGWLAGVLWAGVWLAGATAIAWPDFPGRLANLFGIGRGADLVSYITVLGLLVITRAMYARYRRLEILLTQIARESAIAQARCGAESSGTEPNAS